MDVKGRALLLPYAGAVESQTEDHVALVALLRTLGRGESWSAVTEQVLEQGSAVAVWAARSEATLLPDPDLGAAYEQAARDVRDWASADLRMVGILDEAYPARLREIHQAPPFLFVAGALLPDDPAIAIVGSRAASDRGLEVARRIASILAGEGVTVLSGLATGIDTAAHSAALAAGGRTVAVIGTGITKQYPAANRALQHEIEHAGLVISQFWPDAPATRRSFPMRNAVMSGYGRATVVVEAGEHSGARAQARMAIEHGRAVILTDQVVSANQWAQALVGRPGVYVASGLAEAMRYVHGALDRENQVGRVLDSLSGSGL